MASLRDKGSGIYAAIKRAAARGGGIHPPSESEARPLFAPPGASLPLLRLDTTKRLIYPKDGSALSSGMAELDKKAWERLATGVTLTGDALKTFSASTTSVVSTLKGFADSVLSYEDFEREYLTTFDEATEMVSAKAWEDLRAECAARVFHHSSGVLAAIGTLEGFKREWVDRARSASPEAVLMDALLRSSKVTGPDRVKEAGDIVKAWGLEHTEALQKACREGITLGEAMAAIATGRLRGKKVDRVWVDEFEESFKIGSVSFTGDGIASSAGRLADEARELEEAVAFEERSNLKGFGSW